MDGGQKCPVLLYICPFLLSSYKNMTLVVGHSNCNDATGARNLETLAIFASRVEKFSVGRPGR